MTVFGVVGKGGFNFLNRVNNGIELGTFHFKVI